MRLSILALPGSSDLLLQVFLDVGSASQVHISSQLVHLRLLHSSCLRSKNTRITYSHGSIQNLCVCHDDSRTNRTNHLQVVWQNYSYVLALLQRKGVRMYLTLIRIPAHIKCRFSNVE
jgi:hypothetical protein